MNRLNGIYAAIALCASLTAPQAQASLTSFDHLPADVKVLIFSHPALSIKDKARCAQVSKKWRIDSSKDLVWAALVNKHYKLKDTTFLRMILYTDNSPTAKKIMTKTYTPEYKVDEDLPEDDWTTGAFERFNSRAPTDLDSLKLVEYPLNKMLIQCRFLVAKELGESGEASALLEKKENATNEFMSTHRFLVAAELLGEPSYLSDYLNNKLAEIEFTANTREDKNAYKHDTYKRLITLGSQLAFDSRQSQIKNLTLPAEEPEESNA